MNVSKQGFVLLAVLYGIIFVASFSGTIIYTIQKIAYAEKARFQGLASRSLLKAALLFASKNLGLEFIKPGKTYLKIYLQDKCFNFLIEFFGDESDVSLPVELDVVTLKKIIRISLLDEADTKITSFAIAALVKESQKNAWVLHSIQFGDFL